MLYQATGEGLGWYSEVVRTEELEFPSVHTCHHNCGPGSVLTWLSP